MSHMMGERVLVIVSSWAWREDGNNDVSPLTTKKRQI